MDKVNGQLTLMDKVIKNKRGLELVICRSSGYETKFDGVIQSGFWVIQNIAPANLCKPIHGIINYSNSICPFECGKCGKEEEKLQKFKYLENEKSFLDEIKNIFHSFWRAITWWKNKKMIKNSEHKL